MGGARCVAGTGSSWIRRLERAWSACSEAWSRGRTACPAWSRWRRIGSMLARRLGFWRALAVFVAVEGVLAVWIRDGLLLNVIMLIYPIVAIEAWQAAGH